GHVLVCGDEARDLRLGKLDLLRRRRRRLCRSQTRNKDKGGGCKSRERKAKHVLHGFSSLGASSALLLRAPVVVIRSDKSRTTARLSMSTWISRQLDSKRIEELIAIRVSGAPAGAHLVARREHAVRGAAARYASRLARYYFTSYIIH